jgi:hypothetical protein
MTDPTTDDVTDGVNERQPLQAPPAGAGTPLHAAPIGQITRAIANTMLEVHRVAKRGRNTIQQYNYARMEDILQRLTPLLGKHGLAIFQDEVGRSMFDNDSVIAITYEFTIAHESGEIWFQRLRQTGAARCRDSNGGWDDKAVAKAHTSARKYFLLSLFQIPTGDDADPDQDGPSLVSVTPPERPRGDVKRWVTRFLASVRQRNTLEALNQLLDDRQPLLDRLTAVAPTQRQLIDAAITRRRAELTPPTRALPPLVPRRPLRA